MFSDRPKRLTRQTGLIRCHVILTFTPGTPDASVRSDQRPSYNHSLSITYPAYTLITSKTP